MDKNISEIIEQLSPIERKITPYLNSSVSEITKKSGLDHTSVLRALRFLENKGLLKLKSETKKVIDLGTNGIYYKKRHLPERRLLMLLETSKFPTLGEAKKLSKLSDNEFKVSLGVLKSKALIKIANGKISLTTTKAELTKKFLEEQLLEALPIEESALKPEQKHALQNLKKRKDIIEVKDKKIITFKLTEQGKQIAGKELRSDLIEEVNPKVIKTWSRGKKFRKYDIKSPVPAIHGGKKHFVTQAIEYGRKIWTDLGFKEMTGSLTQTSFWNFDALFQPQDHPVRDMHDTFYIKEAKGKLPDKKTAQSVKQSHESGVNGSKGWRYTWDTEEAKKVILRTHTTCLSAQTLSKLNPSDLPAKFFAIGRNFRNETVDWSHGFEFNQTEGIVIDKKANFRHLLGYLKEFFKKMGFEKIRFTPAYFPYTEPSVEITVWHPKKKVWLELGGAGVFRPEVVIPLLGGYVPVLAWGPGFDRALMDYYGIKDLRELYKNDLKQLRNIKSWTK
jgi:phenylalanyl-tRNA synthetase alpha chain